jgi:hypothetical protein
VEVILERAQWHELVHQDPVMVIGAVANEIDHIFLAQPAQHQDMSEKRLPVVALL